jgi:hypothetical protein
MSFNPVTSCSQHALARREMAAQYSAVFRCDVAVRVGKWSASVPAHSHMPRHEEGRRRKLQRLAIPHHPPVDPVFHKVERCARQFDRGEPKEHRIAFELLCNGLARFEKFDVTA